MNKTEPTAGKWVVEASGFVTADGEIICDASAYVNWPHWLANARLFAASKDLLAACERAYAFHDDLCADSDISVQLRAAIAKAKGES